MSRDRHKNRFWKQQLEYCSDFEMIKIRERQRFPTSTERSEEGILWEKGKTGPTSISDLQNQCSNWELLLGTKQRMGAATLAAWAGAWLQQPVPAQRSAAERANPTCALPESWVQFPPLLGTCGQHSRKTPLEREGRKGPQAERTDDFCFLHMFCIERAITVSKVSWDIPSHCSLNI